MLHVQYDSEKGAEPRFEPSILAPEPIPWLFCQFLLAIFCNIVAFAVSKDSFCISKKLLL